MKYLYCLFFGMVALLLQSLGQDAVKVFPAVENQTFTHGEFMKFRVHYGLITAGYATLKVQDRSVEMHDRQCLHIVGKGNTNAAFDVFYKCRDVYETYVDEKSLLPVQFNRDINEGSFHSYTQVKFDHKEELAYYTDRKKRVKTYKVPDNIQDVISAFYFARTTNDHARLAPGDKISLRNFIDRKTFGLEAVLIEREVIKVEGVKYKALKFKLLVDEAGLITDGSKITFWISDDANKVPLRIKSELMIGSIKADLVEASHLMHPFSSRISK